MRRWAQRTHLAAVLALAVAACARAEHVPVRGGIAVTDDAGRRVTLAAPARRIVSLLPSFTEIVFAIGAGDRLVGRTTWCDYPPEALAVLSVGDGMPPSVEAVAARRPDLVVLYRSGPNVTAAEQLERLGIRTVLFDLNLLEQLGPAARHANGPPCRRGFPGPRHGQPCSPAPNPQHPVPRFYRLGQPTDRDRRGELPRPPRRARGGAQRLPRHRLAFRPGLDRDDRRARPRFRCAVVGQRGAAPICRAP